MSEDRSRPMRRPNLQETGARTRSQSTRRSLRREVLENQTERRDLLQPGGGDQPEGGGARRRDTMSADTRRRVEQLKEMKRRVARGMSPKMNMKRRIYWERSCWCKALWRRSS